MSVLIAAACAGQSPENVLLVVNRNSPESGAIADYYARKRGLPAANVCPVDAPAAETVPREVYERRIRDPIAGCLRAGQRTERILYIVTTLAVPLRIEGSGGMEGETAAVDSELTLLYEWMRGVRHAVRGPLPNPLFRRRDEPFRHPQFPIYLVTRLAAYDVVDVKGMIDRSLAAANRGKFVLDLKSADDKTGNDWLRTAAILLPAGRVVLDESTRVLVNQPDVIGYASWGSNDGNRKQRRLGFRWLPGAIATDFVSTNARTFARPPDSWTYALWGDRVHYFAGSPQGLTADYLAEGATGAAGHVSEPYLQFTPRPDYVFPAYFSGRNLAESFYLGIPALSWQNVVLGDPLCRLK